MAAPVVLDGDEERPRQPGHDRGVGVGPPRLERGAELRRHRDRVVVQVAERDLHGRVGGRHRRLAPEPPRTGHAGHVGERRGRRRALLDQHVGAAGGAPRDHVGAGEDPRRGRGAREVVGRELDGGEPQRHAPGGPQRAGEGPHGLEPGAPGEEVGHHVVDGVVRPVAHGPCGSAGGRGHQPLGAPEGGDPVHLGAVVEGVPGEVLGVAAVGVTARHRHEGRRDVGAPDGEHVGIEVGGDGGGRRHGCQFRRAAGAGRYRR